MISTNGLKRKSSLTLITENNNKTTTSKRFRSIDFNGNSQHDSSQQNIIDKIKLNMTFEHRQLQYELQCQEALLVLMQKLKTNQRILSQTNNTKQRTTTPTNSIKLNSVSSTKQQSTSIHRSTPTKTPHPNQYTVNRSNNNNNNNNNNNSQQSSKISTPLSQATRQSNPTVIPATATRLSSTKTSSVTSTTNNFSKNNGIGNDQNLLNAKLALRKQLEQTLLQIPTPKPSTCDLTYIPGINGWAEFLTVIGLEQAFNTYTDLSNRRLSSDISLNLPYLCAQCGTDWSVTWHDVSTTDETIKNDKILCDRCRKTSQKKILKQDHSNRLRQAFMKALQQEKELDAKFQQQQQQPQQPQQPTATKVKHSSSSSSNKPLSTKINSNHQTNKNSNHHHHHHHHHHHSGKNSSSKHSNSTDTFASTFAALPTNEQIELFQKHFLTNMIPFAVANQAAALAAKSTQQQQQALAASLPAMAASLMRQGNPAQYLLDMIPQAAKQQQQQQQQHRHSK